MNFQKLIETKKTIRYFFVCILLSMTSLSFISAQSAAIVSFSKLKELQNYSISEFESYALSNGFETGHTKFNPDECSYFGFDSTHPEPSGSFTQLSLTSCTGNIKVTAFTSTNKNYYLRFKAILQEKGYRFDRIDPSGDEDITPFNVYVKGNQEVKLYTYKKFGRTYYSVSFIKV